MRVMIGIILAMVLIGAVFRAAYPADPAPTRIAIYDRAGGVEMTNRVQHTVGHSIGRQTSAPPKLGALRALRQDPDARGMYMLDPDLSVHVFVIGVADDPMFVSFQPSRLGHEAVYIIDLEQLLETTGD